MGSFEVPLRIILPLSCSSNPAITLSKVDLPTPFLPITTDIFSDDILKIIYEYIPRCVCYLVNRENHSLNYSIRYEQIMDRMKDNYIRYLLRNDLSFLFEKILNIEYYRWIKKHKYTYKHRNYKNYLEFINFYIYENNSGKCMNIFKQHSLA